MFLFSSCLIRAFLLLCLSSFGFCWSTFAFCYFFHIPVFLPPSFILLLVLWSSSDFHLVFFIVSSFILHEQLLPSYCFLSIVSCSSSCILISVFSVVRDAFFLSFYLYFSFFFLPVSPYLFPSLFILDIFSYCSTTIFLCTFLRLKLFQIFIFLSFKSLSFYLSHTEILSNLYCLFCFVDDKVDSTVNDYYSSLHISPSAVDEGTKRILRIHGTLMLSNVIK